MTSPPPAWHPDPEDPSRLRYWDGQRWTPHVAPRQTVPQAPPATGPLQPPQRPRKVSFFGARKVAQGQAEELEYLRGEMARLGVLDVADLTRERDQLRTEIESLGAKFEADRLAFERQLADLSSRVVKIQEEEILQEVGVYTYRHPLSDSVAYRNELQRLQAQIKDRARTDGGAIHAAGSWQVNGSAADGRKMVRDLSKLMLRAYNAEADNLVRGLKPYKLSSFVDRLEKVVATIERLGRTMSIRVAPDYHRLRVHELELTADYQEMLAREKENERAEREWLREERKVQQEIEREREKLDKEWQHHQNALAALEAKGDAEAAERMRAQLAEVEKKIADVDYRAANVKAGYVYVISNVGAFGERMIKVGLTRRLEPMERIKELSDASVPFNFDVHALFFSENAVDIENEMHQRLAGRRVNRVNLRREFFYATPTEAREHLEALTGELLRFEEMPEALEFHQSSRA